MRKTYSAEKRQFLVLYRSFLMRVIDLELLSANADTARLDKALPSRALRFSPSLPVKDDNEPTR